MSSKSESLSVSAGFLRGSSIGSSTDKLVDTRLVYAHSMAAIGTLFLAVLFGICISLQFILPDLVPESSVFSWGRMRYAHTQGIMLGWLGNAFLAFLYHAVPILTGKQVTSRLLGRWLFGLWNFIVVLPGFVLVLAGFSQPIEWAEFPLSIDAFVIVGLLLAAIQFLPGFFRRGLEDLYISSWYIIGGLVFTLLAYPMGNIIPELVPGAESAAFGGLWIHDAVGLFVTPLALAILYFVIPAVSGRPIFSHFLSMFGFWGLFFLYPLNGTHHYVFSVIPMAAQMGAIAASALLGIIVVIVVTNLTLSLRGSGLIPKDIGLRFVVMSIFFYLLVSIQGSFQAQMSLNQAVHFTDWVVAHSHLAMLGFATFAAIGGIIHAWQRISWARYNAAALNWSFWLLVVGIGIMFIDLTIAGIIQANLWLSGAPWLESVQASKPYWFIRILSAIPITAGFIALFIGLVTGTQGAGAKAIELGANEQKATDVHPSFASKSFAQELGIGSSGQVLRMSYFAAMLAGVGFFAVSVILLGVLPGKVLDQQIALMSPENVLKPTISEIRGRAIYAREGCAYCHTQQIRYTEADIRRFGAPTLAWEGQFDFPHLWGTRRIGPDLARAGATRSADWQLLHLYSPRTVVPLSVMPSYSSLFDGAPDKPKQEAYDLLAFIESLGRAREIAWPDGDKAARELVLEDKWALMSFDAPLLNAHPNKTRARGEFPDFGEPASSEIAQQLWLDNCATCHGETGQGDGLAAAWLEPRPGDFTQYEYTDNNIADALWNGIDGTAMPAWRDQSPENLAALVTFVQGLSLSGTGSETEVDSNELILGQQVYVANCIQCHGIAGDGNGFAASELDVAPTDFRNKRPSISESIRVLQNGIDGLSMAPWNDRLSANEMLAVTHYLRGFFNAGGRNNDSSEGVN